MSTPDLTKSINQVVIVGPLPPPAGGMANQTRKLSELLTAEGLSVSIIQVNASYRPRWVGKIKGLRALCRLLPYLLALTLGTRRCDLVHIMANSGWSWYLYALPAIIISRLNGRVVVVNYRGGYATEFFARSWSKVKLGLKQVQGIMVPSAFLQQVFAGYHQTVDVVPNVLDSQLFCPRQRRFAQDGLHLVVTRNLESIYGVDTVLEAFAIVCQQHPDARLSIAGTGPQLAALQTQVVSLALQHQVTFTGRLTPQQMASLYQKADITLNASRVDNTPNSIIESLACATVVVSTDVGGIPQLVSHQFDALLVPVNDAELMAQQVFSLIQDPPLRDKLVNNGLDTIKKFYWKNVWQQLSRCYGQAQAQIQAR